MGNLIRISSPSTSTPDLSRVDLRAGQAGHHAGPHGQTGLEEDAVSIPIHARESEDFMLDQLDRRDRMRLVEFVCSFAWVDLEIQPEERVFISRLIRRLGLDDDEDLRVQKWLESPPSVDDVDPTSIPAAHRRIFVESIEGLIAADGQIAEEESDTLEIFKQLLVG